MEKKFLFSPKESYIVRVRFFNWTFRKHLFLSFYFFRYYNNCRVNRRSKDTTEICDRSINPSFIDASNTSHRGTGKQSRETRAKWNGWKGKDIGKGEKESRGSGPFSRA